MESYKKKSLKFSGLGRDIRAAELNAARESSRLKRFSLLRPIDDVSTDEDPKENIPTSRIPTFGNKKSQTISRVEMLKKWKNEKLLKKKVELQSQKPAFKIGIAPLKLEPSTDSFNKVNKFGLLSRIQSSDVSSNLKPPKVTNDDAKGSRKIPFSGVSKPIIQKPAVPSLQLPRKQQISNIKPKGLMPANQSKSNPALLTEKHSIIPKSGVAKPTIQKPAVPSLLPPRKQQISNIKPKSQIPANQSNTQNQPSKLNKPGIKSSNPVVKSANPVVKSANPAPVKQLGTTFRKPAEKSIPGKVQPNKVIDKSSASKGQNSRFPVNDKPAFRKPAEKSIPGKVQPKKIIDESSASEGQNSMFRCQLSVIEPVEEEKSFAPKGFVFHPPIGLQTSWSMEDEDGILEIYARVKKEMEENIRTSTPKRLEWNTCQDPEDESDIMATSFTVASSIAPTSEETRSSSVSSSETKYIECLLDNSPSEIKSSVPISSPDTLLEEAQSPEILTTKENPEGIHPEDGCLEIRRPEPTPPEAVPLEITHPQPNALEIDMKPELFSNASPVVSSDTKDRRKTSAETDSEQARLCQNGSPTICFPVPNETKGFPSALCLPKDDAIKIPEFCLLGMDQERNTAFEKSGRRFTRSHRRIERPSLLKISESPENRETPKAHQKSSACTEFTPRRSTRLARLSQFNSVENLSSPGKESSRLTEDFKNLNLESLGDTIKEPRMSTRSSTALNSDVSLLYTPPRRRASSRIKLSLAGDLMTFSPSV